MKRARSGLEKILEKCDGHLEEMPLIGFALELKITIELESKLMEFFIFRKFTFVGHWHLV